MAGLLAWAADVVGGSGQGAGVGDPAAAFTAEQKRYAAELEQRAATLRAAINDLRARIPPADIAKSLPHLHAHSLASNAALALQLNAHSTTRQQAQIREEALQEENIAYERAIHACEKRIQEKLDEALLLQDKLKQMDEQQKELEAKVNSLRLGSDHSLVDASGNSNGSTDIGDMEQSSKRINAEQLDEKKKELASTEELIQSLENNWALLQQDFSKKPTPAQREKLLERQLHSLIEQLTAKQAQAEDFMSEIRNKQLELEKLNALSRKLGSGTSDVCSTRNRSWRTGMLSADAGVEASQRYSVGGKIESIPKSMIFRSAFVLYVLALHVLVFIKISL